LWGVHDRGDPDKGRAEGGSYFGRRGRNQSPEERITPMHVAVATGEELIVRMLIERGANRESTNIHDVNRYSWPWNGNIDMLRMLIQTRRGLLS